MDRIFDSLDFSQISPDSCVVIATGGRFDEEAVEQALSLGARYIALVANKRRARAVLSLTKGCLRFPWAPIFMYFQPNKFPNFPMITLITSAGAYPLRYPQRSLRFTPLLGAIGPRYGVEMVRQCIHRNQPSILKECSLRNCDPVPGFQLRRNPMPVAFRSSSDWSPSR